MLVLLTMPLRTALFRLPVPLWLQFPSQCWWSTETGWPWGRDPPLNPTRDKTVMGKVDFLSAAPQMDCVPPTVSIAGGGHPSLVLPEFGEQRERLVPFHGEGLKRQGVEKTFLNVGQRLSKPGLSGHGLDDLMGLSHS